MGEGKEADKSPEKRGGAEGVQQKGVQKPHVSRAYGAAPKKLEYGPSSKPVEQDSGIHENFIMAKELIQQRLEEEGGEGKGYKPQEGVVLDVARSSEWNYGERSFVLSANSLSGDSVYEESTGVDSEEDAQSMYELIGHNADNERGVTLSSDFSCNRSKVIDVKEDDDAMSASQHVGTLSVHQVFHPVGPASLLLRQVANRFLRHKIGEFVGNRCTLCDEKRAS